MNNQAPWIVRKAYWKLWQKEINYTGTDLDLFLSCMLQENQQNRCLIFCKSDYLTMPIDEIKIAAAEQINITKNRLEKLFA